LRGSILENDAWNVFVYTFEDSNTQIKKYLLKRPGTLDPGPWSPEPGAGSRDPGPGTRDPELGIREPRTQESGPRGPATRGPRDPDLGTWTRGPRPGDVHFDVFV